jgi:hypothetical protein
MKIIIGIGIFVLGFIVGSMHEPDPHKGATLELAFRAYIMGCVESAVDVDDANNKCARQALQYQKDIEEILDQ